MYGDILLRIAVALERIANVYAPRKKERWSVLDTPVDELELSVRALNCLDNAGIRQVRDLVRFTDVQLLAEKNFGRRTLKEINDVLHGMGLELSK